MYKYFRLQLISFKKKWKVKVDMLCLKKKEEKKKKKGFFTINKFAMFNFTMAGVEDQRFQPSQQRTFFLHPPIVEVLS